MPRSVEGLLDHRGQVIPVISLRSRMNLAHQDAALSRNIVVLDLGGGSPVGVLVDAVDAVVSAAPEQMVPASPLLAGPEGRLGARLHPPGRAHHRPAGHRLHHHLPRRPGPAQPGRGPGPGPGPGQGAQGADRARPAQDGGRRRPDHPPDGGGHRPHRAGDGQGGRLRGIHAGGHRQGLPGPGPAQAGSGPGPAQGRGGRPGRDRAPGQPNCRTMSST